MSGSGRKTNYRKSVTNDLLNDEVKLEENDEIACIVGSRGTNIFEIVLPTKKKINKNDEKIENEIAESTDNDGDDEVPNLQTIHLAMMPSKFKRLVWIKRGDYVVVTRGHQENNMDSNRSTNDADTKQSDNGAKSSAKMTAIEKLNAKLKNKQNSNKGKSKKNKNTDSSSAVETVVNDTTSSMENISEKKDNNANTSLSDTNKVQYLIKTPLTDEHIVYLYEHDSWPDFKYVPKEETPLTKDIGHVVNKGTYNPNHNHMLRDINASISNMESKAMDDISNVFDISVIISNAKQSKSAYQDVDIMPNYIENEDIDLESMEEPDGTVETESNQISNDSNTNI